MNSQMKSCPVCQGQAPFRFEAQILGKYSARYFDCGQCGYLFIDQPTWLKEAYSEAISSLDTGIMVRNLNASSFFSLLFYSEFKGKGPYLDYCGGYGVLARLMRDCGFEFYWEDAYCENLLVRGFEARPEQKFFLTTALECFEHFEDPIQHFEKLFSRSENLIISTELVPDGTPDPRNWHYYCLNTGQHIGFFRTQTLKWIANKFGMHFYSLGAYQFFFQAPIPEAKIKLIEWVSRKFPVYKFIQKVNGCLAYSDPERVKASS